MFMATIQSISSRGDFQENSCSFEYCIIDLILVEHRNPTLIFLIIMLVEGEVMGKFAIIYIAFSKIVIEDESHIADYCQLFYELLIELGFNKNLVA